MNKLFYQIRTRLYWGKLYVQNRYVLEGQEKTLNELSKEPQRFDVINYLLSLQDITDTNYLEIGVRNPDSNFNKINAKNKYGVDPGYEFIDNPVDFIMTSDEFFLKLNANEILNKEIRFDVIFIDGLHLAEQVDRDVENSLLYLKEDGFIVLHDCNPPTEYHAREDIYYDISPAKYYWNGTTWKAFYKYRFNKDVSCVCVDSDFGIGVITKKKIFNSLDKNINPFYEFKIFEANRAESINLMSFENFKEIVDLTRIK